MPVDEAESLDEHWAVAVFEPADRRDLLSFAEEIRRQVLTGEWQHDRQIPEQLLPLSSAYELAARERLDLFGTGHPNTSASLEQRTERARILEAGARRAFDLSLAIPLDDTDAHGGLYHTLLLGALAAVGARDFSTPRSTTIGRPAISRASSSSGAMCSTAPDRPGWIARWSWWRPYERTAQTVSARRSSVQTTSMACSSASFSSRCTT